jgi:hypothetical protein
MQTKIDGKITSISNVYAVKDASFKAITNVYAIVKGKAVQIWTAIKDIIGGVFGSGIWNSTELWNNDDLWKNDQ